MEKRTFLVMFRACYEQDIMTMYIETDQQANVTTFANELNGYKGYFAVEILGWSLIED